MSHDRVIGLYARHARDFDRDRSRALHERAWLDAFLERVTPGGAVLDVGCGSGEPIARYLREAGCTVTGVDAAPAMIAFCQERFPDGDWILADMRSIDLKRQFDGIVAWDSFFHLCGDDQRAMFARFAAHARPGAGLLFTSGPAHGEAVGSCYGEPLYHASLDPGDYRDLLAASGFTVVAHRQQDPDCGGHTVWLARQG